nr:Bet1 golgi vesicular membrane trafficking protein like [Molossus molossus]
MLTDHEPLLTQGSLEAFQTLPGKSSLGSSPFLVTFLEGETDKSTTLTTGHAPFHASDFVRRRIRTLLLGFIFGDSSGFLQNTPWPSAASRTWLASPSGAP